MQLPITMGFQISVFLWMKNEAGLVPGVIHNLVALFYFLFDVSQNLIGQV